MIRIHNFKLGVYEYHTRGKQNIYPDLKNCPQKDCLYSGRLWHHGFYSRNAIGLKGFYRIYIKRYRCPYCGHTVSLLPNFLAPHFQYTLLAIFTCLHALGVLEKTLKQAADSTGIYSMGYQHAAFYRNRLLENKNLCLSVLFGLGITNKKPFISFWAEQVEQLDVKYFALEFKKRWDRSFLSLS